MDSMASPTVTGHDVLVSFCNQPLAAPGVAKLRISDGQAALVCTGLPYTEAGTRQVTGLTSWLGTVYFVGRLGARFAIARLAPDLTITEQYELSRVRAAHSLVATGPDEFYVVSSRTDEVIRVLIDPTAGTVVAEETVWEPGRPGTREDLHHLNGLTRANGRLIVAGFGERWREVREQRRQGNTTAPYDGFLVDLATGERLLTGLQMPHSPLMIDEHIAVCESAAEAVIVPGIGVADGLPGYTRGLCVAGDRILVGISRARQNHPGRQSDICVVVMLDRHDLTVRGMFDVSAVGGEIYDLLPVN